MSKKIYLRTHTLGLKEHFKFSDLGDRGMATSGAGALGQSIITAREKAREGVRKRETKSTQCKFEVNAQINLPQIERHQNWLGT